MIGLGLNKKCYKFFLTKYYVREVINFNGNHFNLVHFHLDSSVDLLGTFSKCRKAFSELYHKLHCRNIGLHSCFTYFTTVAPLFEYVVFNPKKSDYE